MLLSFVSASVLLPLVEGTTYLEQSREETSATLGSGIFGCYSHDR